MTDRLGEMLRDVLCTDAPDGKYHLLPIELEDRVKPLVWEWEADVARRAGR